MTQGKEEKKFNKIKESISKETKLILDEIWNYNLDSDRKWILTSQLHHKFGKEVVIKSLCSLNSSIVKEFSDIGRKRCYLTFLGMLLTSDGEKSIDLFIDYLSFTQMHLRGDLGVSKI